jgi:fructose-1,6-bisphosphatase/sedoheptulose 1,7-bisphosphatase-like protein
MGRGEPDQSDRFAVQAMRREFERVPIDGTIVIGEGERDKAPMLYIGEQVGSPAPPGVMYPKVDIAVDPLEGTNLCATGAANSIVLAASARRSRAGLPWKRSSPARRAGRAD